MKPYTALWLIFLFFILPFCGYSQEENATVVKDGTHYVDLKLKALDKYNSRIEKQQDRLLKKLKKQENRLAHKLKKTDSLAYARYRQQTLSFDSIGKISKSDTGSTAEKFSKRKNLSIDSLRGIQSFVQQKSRQAVNVPKSTDSSDCASTNGQPTCSDSTCETTKPDTVSNAEKLSKKKNAAVDSVKHMQSIVQQKSGLAATVPGAQVQSASLSEMQGKLNFRNYITQLITQRTNSLNNLQGSEGSVPGLTGIQKQVFYAKARMSVFKDMEEDPSKVEDKALEYLQGTNGFDQAMKNATDGTGGMQSSAAAGGDPSQLEKMGYQTKSLLQASMQKSFGPSLGAASKLMSSGISSWQEKQKELADLKDTKNSIEKIGGTDKPSFKVNPMRGLPFKKRLVKQYSWQPTPASADGSTPAMITPSVMVGFKHTPKLIYGVGMAASIGLGQSWQDIHLSFQGIGYRTFATWEWQYGIGVYAGYERMYKAFVFTQNTGSAATDITTTPHDTPNYDESLLIGLTKSYHMNSKYNGAIQVLYDVWWQQKGLNSPIVVRFITTTK